MPHSCLFPNCLLQTLILQAADASGSGKSRGETMKDCVLRKWCSCHGKWASCPDKHFSPTGIGIPSPLHPLLSTAQFPNSTVDSLANIFPYISLNSSPRSIHRGATADVTFFPDESLWLPSRLLPLALGNVSNCFAHKFFRTSPSPWQLQALLRFSSNSNPRL